MSAPGLVVPAGQVFNPAPLERCAWCGQLLSPRGPSPWFCATNPWVEGEIWSPCQARWYAWRAGLDDNAACEADTASLADALLGGTPWHA